MKPNCCDELIKLVDMKDRTFVAFSSCKEFQSPALWYLDKMAQRTFDEIIARQCSQNHQHPRH